MGISEGTVKYDLSAIYRKLDVRTGPRRPSPGYGSRRPSKTVREGGSMTERDEQGGDAEVGVCHVCGKEFDTQLALSKHLMDVHDENLLPAD